MTRLYYYIIFSFIFLTISVNVQAQDTSIKGIVIDCKSDETIISATVQLYIFPDTISPVAYSITGNDGSFKITSNKNHSSYLIKISSMGYKSYCHNVKPGDYIKVRLEENRFTLDEVVIKRRMPAAKVKNDTVEYNIKHYTNGSEQVLNDILKKLPGIEVGENGKVTAAGKSVDKVLLNGRDFLGDNSERLTQSLPSDMVNKIQLIKNYNEYSLLDGFSSHNKTAINVGLDKSHQNRITGNAELAGGLNNRYRSKVNLYSFFPKTMLGFNFVVDNTGENVIDIKDYIRLLGGVKNFAKSLDGDSRIITSEQTQMPLLNLSEDFLSRKSTLATLTLASNPTDKLRINAYYIFNRMNDTYLIDGERNYISDSTNDYHISKQGKQSNDYHKFSTTLDFSLSDKTLLNYKADLQFIPVKENYVENDGEMQSNSLESKKMILDNSLSFVYKGNKKNLFNINISYKYENSCNNFLLNSNSPIISQINTVVSQKQKISRQNISTLATYMYKLDRLWVFQTNIFGNKRVQDFASKASEKDLNISDTKFNLNDAGLSAIIKKTNGLLRGNMGIDVARIWSNYSLKNWVCSPNLYLELYFNSVHSLSFSYKQLLTPNNNPLFLKGADVEDYKTVNRYNGTDEMLSESKDLQLNYNYFDIFSDLSIIITGGYSESSPDYIKNYSTLDKALNVTWIKDNSKSRLLYASMRINKGLVIPIKFEMKADYAQSGSCIGYSSIKSKDKMDNLKGEFFITSRFKSPLNIKTGVKGILNNYKIGLLNRNYLYHSVSYIIQPLVTIKDKFNFEMPLSYVAEYSADKDSYWNISFKTSLHLNKKGLIIYSEAYNLLNWKTFKRYTLENSNNYIQNNISYRMPGYIVFGLRTNI